jgi:hypothetical protein
MPEPKIVKALEKTGKCGGAMFQIRWDVDEAARKQGGGGAVVQLVDVEWKVTDCCGAEIKPKWKDGTYPSWEAWPFDADPKTDDVMEDVFDTPDQGDKTKGRSHQNR